MGAHANLYICRIPAQIIMTISQGYNTAMVEYSPMPRFGGCTLVTDREQVANAAEKNVTSLSCTYELILKV